jgi:hypothetical protein
MIDLFNSNNGWDTQPVYSELTDWKSVGKSGAGIDIISAFADGLRSSLDYLVVRQGPCLSEQCEIRIVGTRDGKRHDEIISRKGSLVRYFSADDGEPVLLGINGTNDYLPSISNKMSLRKKVLLTDCVSEKWDVEKWCSSEQWRELSSMTPKPDSVMQLIALYEDDRAGTINLFPKDGVGYNTRVVGRHAGESYLEKDAFIGFWGKPTNGVKDRLPYAENGSLAPTIFEYLTGDKVIPNQDGWGYPSLLDVVTVK